MKVDSFLDAGEMARARALLEPPVRRQRLWPAVAAATALAFTSLLFATIMILAPPVTTEHVVKSAPK